MDSDHTPFIHQFAAQRQSLADRLYSFLKEIDTDLRADVLVALSQENKIFAQPAAGDNHSPSPAILPGLWPLLTLSVSHSISPEIDFEQAATVAIAVECFVCALDLLDDIEDDDQTRSVQLLGTARVLNVSTALLTLTQRAILSLAQYATSPTQALRLLAALQEATLVAVSGQHRDLLAEQKAAQDISVEDCIDIASAKAGAIMGLACKLGAMCAGATDEVCRQFAELGELSGIAQQLDNDAHDLYHLLNLDTSVESPEEETILKTDLVRQKKTMPVVLAAQQPGNLQKKSVLSDEEKQEYLRNLHEGILTTWGMCLLYRERARDCLQEIEAQNPIASSLRFLLGFD